MEVGLLMLPQFSHLGLGLVVEPMFIANWLSQTTLFRWTQLSVAGDPVQSSSGITISADRALAQSDQFDAVFVFSSFETRKNSKTAQLLNWLRRQARYGAEICGVETGSELLAAAGLLDDLEVAVHWDNLKGFNELFPDVDARPWSFSIKERRITGAGGIPIADMVLRWMTQFIPEALAHEISEHLLMETIREPHRVQLQKSRHKQEQSISPAIQHSIELMRHNLEEPVSCAEIARLIGLARRQFERRFRKETSESPLQYYLKVRLAKAHRLLQQTEMTVIDIALSSGFSSPEHFSRKYHEVFGRPPSSDREQSTASPVMRQMIDIH